MASNIQFKRGTAAALYALNPVLLRGEPGLEVDTNKIKYGNGVTPWRNLPYANPALEVVDGGEFTAGAVPAEPDIFSPPTIAGLKLWLDADNADYVHRVNNRVSVWEDASESGAKFVQSSKSSRPQATNQLASKDVVTFDGDNDVMLSKFDLPAEFTLLVALRRRGRSTSGKLITAYTTDSATELVLCGTETGTTFGVQFDGDYLVPQSVDNMQPVVYTLQFSAAGISTRANGSDTQYANSISVSGLTHLALGGDRVDFASDNYSGDIAEVVLYDSVLSAADLIDAENYMLARWGVVSVNHPLLTGMRAFWRLNEESGSRLGITALQVPLTQVGTVGFSAGVINNAAELPGGNNYLQAPSSFALAGSFSVSAWFKAASMSGGRAALVQNWAAGNASGQLEIGFGDTGLDTNAVFGRIATSAATYSVVAPDLTANFWHHVVLVYSASDNTLTLYINGLQAAQVATSGSFSAGNIPLRVGIGDQTATQNNLACLVDQLGVWDRVLSLQDVQMLYNYELGKENFTVDLDGNNVSLLLHMDKPANALALNAVDPYINNATLLLHFNGTNGSKNIVDSSPQDGDVTVVGDIQISTTQSKFGGASLRCPDSYSDYLDGFADVDLSTGSWTVECWFLTNGPNIGNNRTVLSAGYQDYPNRWIIDISVNALGLLPRIYGVGNSIYAGGEPPNNAGGGATPTPYTYGTWAHVAWVNDSAADEFAMYVNGVRVYTRDAFNLPKYNTIQIGQQASVFGSEEFYIDELRVLNIAVYTANFSPPTAPFGNSLLPVAEFIDTSKHNHAVTPAGNAQLRFENSKYGNASGAFAADGHCELEMAPEFAFDDGDFTVEFWGKLNYVQYSAVFSTASSAQEPGTYIIGFRDDANMFGFCYDIDNFTFIAANISAYYDMWTHYAFVRLDGVLKMYVNGVEAASATTAMNLDGGSQTTAVIGRRWTNEDEHYLNGLLDDFRITKGVARYAAEFTPPPRALPDPVIPAPPPPQNDALPAEYVTLLLHMDGADASTTFVDNSYLQHTVTAEGSAAISTAQSKFGGASAYFDGNAYLTVPPENLTLSEDNWTVEMWFYPTTNSGYMALFSHNICGTQLFGYEITLDFGGWQPGRHVRVFFGDGPNVGYGPGHSNLMFPIPDENADNKWTHLAVTRAGQSVRCFWNGVQIGPTATSNLAVNPLTGVDCDVTIGGRFCTSPGSLDAGFQGYIDDLRITPGVARYTENFTLPTTPFPSPFTPNLTASLLLHFDGENDSPDFADSSQNSLQVTSNNGAVISTAQSKFGGASGYFLAGSGSYLSINASDAFDFDSGDFCIEAWIKLQTGGKSICSGNAIGDYMFATGVYGAGDIGFGRNGLTWDLLASNPGLTSEWNHVAVARSGTTLRLFCNGVVVATGSGNSLAYNVQDTLWIGARVDSGPAEFFNGYIDEFRIVKGSAVYTRNFTPPTAPLSATSEVTPTDVAGCDLWLDSTAEIGTLNGSITVWPDKSGNTRPATPADYAPAPTLAVGEGLAGQNVVRFSGDPNVLDVAYEFNLKNSSGFVVLKQPTPLNAPPGFQRILAFQPTTGIDAQQNDGLALVFNNYTTDGVELYSNGDPPIGQHAMPLPADWTLLAYTIDNSGNLSLRVNGEEVDTGVNASMAQTAGGNLYIGHGGTFAIDEALHGDIAEVVIFDHALGDAALIGLERGLLARCLPPTPPPPPPPPSYDGPSALLLHFDGENNSPDFADSGQNSLQVTSNNGAVISTAQSKFGGASGYFAGGSWLTAPASADFAYGTGDFTIEMWMYFDGANIASAIQVLYAQSQSGSNYCVIALFYGSVVFLYGYGNPANYVYGVSGSSVTANAWHHVAVCRLNGVFKVYVNGVSGVPVTDAFDFDNTTLEPTIGSYGHNQGYNFTGYIDELRVIKGYAAYPANFTPLTTPFNP